jgi:hypothetical protein
MPNEFNYGAIRPHWLDLEKTEIKPDKLTSCISMMLKVFAALMCSGIVVASIGMVVLTWFLVILAWMS